MTVHVIYNPKSDNGGGTELTHNIEKLFDGVKIDYIDFTGISDIDAYMSQISEDDKVVLSGGDGTVNYYVNHTSEETRAKKIGYYATGSGNDFAKDIPEAKDNYIDDISPYLENLPEVCVNGKKALFVNGIGFGIDGYCCEKGDALRLVSDKPINYTSIAIKGALYDFAPLTAEVTVDGKKVVYKNAWMASAMNGCYYGGGMKAAPEQNRLSSPRTLTSMVFHSGLRLRVLMVFSKIFTGDHVKSRIVDTRAGKKIEVKFSRPCALQIDGETVTGVTEYTAHTAEGE